MGLTYRIAAQLSAAVSPLAGRPSLPVPVTPRGFAAFTPASFTLDSSAEPCVVSATFPANYDPTAATAAPTNPVVEMHLVCFQTTPAGVAPPAIPTDPNAALAMNGMAGVVTSSVGIPSTFVAGSVAPIPVAGLSAGPVTILVVVGETVS